MRAVVLSMLVLVGCSTPAEPNTGTAARPAIDSKLAAAMPTALNEDGGTCGTGWDDGQLAESATAPFDQIDLQLDDSPTFSISAGMAGTRPYTRLPAFTLYRDGTVFYPDASDPERPVTTLLTAKVDREAADELRKQVLALGAEQLQSHVDSCSCPKDTPMGKVLVCADDAGFHILRFRDAQGSLRHVVVYSSFWNKPEIASRVVHYLRAYRAPAATTYIPTKAVAVIEHLEAGNECDGPLDRSLSKLLAPPAAGELSIKVTVLEGDALRLLAAKMPAGGGHTAWCKKDATVRAHLYPSLPGMDHREGIARLMRSFRE